MRYVIAKSRKNETNNFGKGHNDHGRFNHLKNCMPQYIRAGAYSTRAHIYVYFFFRQAPWANQFISGCIIFLFLLFFIPYIRPTSPVEPPYTIGPKPNYFAGFKLQSHKNRCFCLHDAQRKYTGYSHQGTGT